jgi:hypothetical protein
VCALLRVVGLGEWGGGESWGVLRALGR